MSEQPEEQTELDQSIEAMARMARRKSSDLNSFILGSFLTVINAVRKEYTEGFDATFEAIESIRDGASDQDVELVQRSQAIIAGTAVFAQSLLAQLGWCDDKGNPNESMPADKLQAFTTLQAEITAYLHDAEEFLQSIDDDDDDEDDEDDEDEDEDEDDEDGDLAAGVPTVAPAAPSPLAPKL